MKYKQSEKDKKEMNFAMRLSFGVGLLILCLKMYAYFLTGSTVILSDAAESVIHVFAVAFAAYSMWLSLKPPDQEHLYGHEKVGFFSAGFEGAMIIGAACFIVYESVEKIIFGLKIENVDTGLEFLLLVIVINFVLAVYLIRKGKKYQSIVLEANGKHILTDCWTSFAAVIALILVKLTGFFLFDPIIAILAGMNILWTGSRLIKRSVGGLMDQADMHTHAKILSIIEKETKAKNLKFHHLRHRQSGAKVFIEFHLLFPKDMTLALAHDIACEIEAALQSSIEQETDIFTHLEPQESHDLAHYKHGLPI